MEVKQEALPEQQAQLPARAIQPTAVLPVLSGAEMATAYTTYRAFQAELDKAMPDCIQSIQGKNFRKKNYWRAIRTGFNLAVVCLSEKRIQIGDDWGYEVTYRATAPNGAVADGDGSCMASEKSRGRMQATLHNVRSHAHTRAFNRAVSNLVGFGEVSAEEVNHDHDDAPLGQQLADKFNGKVVEEPTAVVAPAHKDATEAKSRSASPTAAQNAAAGSPVCPKCGAEVVNQIGKTSKAGKKLPAFKCSTNRWNPETKKAEGCDWIEWDEKFFEKQAAPRPTQGAKAPTNPEVTSNGGSDQDIPDSCLPIGDNQVAEIKQLCVTLGWGGQALENHCWTLLEKHQSSIADGSMSSADADTLIASLKDMVSAPAYEPQAVNETIPF